MPAAPKHTVVPYFRLEAGVARRYLSEEIEFALINVGSAGNARL
jgi:hypothetical protein